MRKMLRLSEKFNTQPIKEEIIERMLLINFQNLDRFQSLMIETNENSQWLNKW